MNKNYALVKIGGPVIGLGESQEEALEDALRAIPEIKTLEQLKSLLSDPAFAVDGELTVCECSQEFYDYVKTNGGQVAFNPNSNGTIGL